jgi:hypothetical protein
MISIQVAKSINERTWHAWEILEGGGIAGRQVRSAHLLLRFSASSFLNGKPLVRYTHVSQRPYTAWINWFYLVSAGLQSSVSEGIKKNTYLAGDMAFICGK